MVINLATSLDVKWEQYSGVSKEGFWGGLATGTTEKQLANPSTYLKAWEDPIFRHNNTLNLIQMSVLGSLTCVSNIKMGLGLNALSSAALSVLSQAMTTGTVDYKIVAFDTAFLFVISTNKNKLVFWISERMRASSMPTAKVFFLESIMQLISEGIGGTLYAQALDRVLPEPPKD